MRDLIRICDAVQDVDWSDVPAPQCIVTSPPYYCKRTYEIVDSDFGDWRGQLGQEPSVDLFINHLTDILANLPLRDDGVMWINIADGYDKKGVLQLIPARLAMAMNARGFVTRSNIVWRKNSCIPTNATDRPENEYESVLLIAKQRRYKYYRDAVMVPMSEAGIRLARTGRWTVKYKGNVEAAFNGNIKPREIADDAHRPIRNVWTIAASVNKHQSSHVAPMAEELVGRCILLSTDAGDYVLDPFAGAGTTMRVARELGRRAIGVELDTRFAEWTTDIDAKPAIL